MIIYINKLITSRLTPQTKLQRPIFHLKSAQIYTLYMNFTLFFYKKIQTISFSEVFARS